MKFFSVLGKWLLSNGGIMIAAISGIFSVFADHKSGRKWTIVVVAGVIGGMIWSLASAHYSDEQQKIAMEDTINRVDKYVETQSTATVSQVDTNTRAALNDLMHQYLGVRVDVAQRATPEQANAIVSAGSDANNLVQRIPPERRNALTIWVFPHAQEQVDYGVVKTRLQQLAAHVETPPNKQKAALTNSVWYGVGNTVSLDEAKAAALTAASAGLQIRQICHSTTVPLPNLIQIGGSVRAQSMPVLTTAQIQGLNKDICE